MNFQGGVICKLKNENYGIAFLNIGDCKAFRYCKKDGTVTDVRDGEIYVIGLLDH